MVSPQRLLVTVAWGLAALLLQGCLSLEPDPNELSLGASAPPLPLVTLGGEILTVGGPREDSLMLIFFRGHW